MIPILPIRNLRHRDTVSYTGHTANTQQTQDLNPGRKTKELRFSATRLFHYMEKIKLKHTL